MRRPEATGSIQARHAVAKKKPVGDRLDLARLFLGIEPVGADFVGRFVKAFREEDSTMPATDNGELLKVLAGSVLAFAFEKGDEGADAAALALVSAHYGGEGAAGAPIPRVIEQAARYLDVRSRAVRDLDRPPSTGRKNVSRGPDSKTSLTKGLSKPTFAAILSYQNFAIADSNFEAIGPVLQGLLSAVDALEKQLNHIVSTANTAITDAKKAGDPRVEVLREETDLLWWVLSEYSDLAGSPLAELDPAARGLFAAHELSERTQRVPGHAGATGFLSRAVGDTDVVVDMYDAVESVPRSVRSRWSEGLEAVSAKGIMPLTHAMVASLQVGDGADWRPIADAAPGPDSEAELAVLPLAEQFYTETLLARLVRAAS